MAQPGSVHTAAYQRFRASMLQLWRAANAPCYLCGQNDIDWDGPANAPNSFELEHKLPRITYPQYTLDPNNAFPSHHRCNRGKGAGRAVAELGITSEQF